MLKQFTLRLVVIASSIAFPAIHSTPLFAQTMRREGAELKDSGLAGSPMQLVSDTSAQRAKDLLDKMTVEEKVGQLNLLSGIGLGPGMKGVSDEDVIQGRVGSVLYQANTKEINRMQHLAMEKSRLHIPLLFGLDVVHGYRTAFPIPLAMASSWDPSKRQKLLEFVGSSHLWSTLRVTLVGGVFRKALAKIHFWERPWRELKSTDSKEPLSVRTALLLA